MSVSDWNAAIEAAAKEAEALALRVVTFPSTGVWMSDQAKALASRIRALRRPTA